MLEKQRLTADIRRGLGALQNYIRPGGILNLTDSNVHAEDFLAGLLNVLFGLSLVNVNGDNANYPCIDLADEDQGLAVQVTSEGGSAKLKESIECLKRHSIKGIRHLKVFSLIPKQRRYTVRVECPGIEFDWRKDVLDFDDVVKVASRIADLTRLRRVHEYIVGSIPTIFPEYQRQTPTLTTPTTDPAIAWLAFSSRATSLVGRDSERGDLFEFVNSAPKFSWWLVTGVGGSGKSRLALELCLGATNWHAGFLSRTETDFDWSQFRPSRKTLIVIDYVASRAKDVSDLVLTLTRNSTSFEYPVRVLLLERSKQAWWSTFSRDESHSEAAAIAACQYQEPLVLAALPVDAILQLAEEVVCAKHGTWDVADQLRYLFLLDRFGPDCRPLFAMIVAQEIDEIESDESISQLLRKVLSREAGRRRQLVRPEDFQRMENLLLLSSLVGGLLPRSDGFNYIGTSDVADLLPNVSLLNDDLYNDLAGATRGGSSLSGLQPDILGERFILDRLAAGGIAGTNAHRLLRAAWALQPKDLQIVVIRSTSDFVGDRDLRYLYDLPIDTDEARTNWVAMVGQVIGPTGGEDPFVRQQLERAIRLADSSPKDRKLQEAAALGEYNMGCTLMSRGYRGRDRDNAKLDEAAARFDDVVARVGNDAVIGTYAVLNRGCIFKDRGEKDKAIDSFTTVIESQGAPDETRACALNNRANIFADRNDHEQAIRDRSEVLALKATSSDRRFVALFGRSESYCAMKNHEAALHDLDTIKGVDDISPSDKLWAAVERAVVLNRLGRCEEARAQLQGLIDTEQAPNELRTQLVSLLADKCNDVDENRKMWEQLSSDIRRSANRIRITRPRIDEATS